MRAGLGMALAIAVATATPAPASPVSAVGGYDHYAGPFGQQTDGVLGAVVVGAAGADFTLAGVRYDDTSIGRGFNVTGGVGVPLVPLATFRVQGSRYVGDETFRAWRAKVGPQLNLPGDRTVTLSYSHYQDNLSDRSDGAIAEATTPLIAQLGGKASASFASTAVGPAALQGSLGLTWTPIRYLALSGEVGVSRNASGATGAPFPSQGPLDQLPIIGGGQGSSQPATEVRNHVEGTVLLGVRLAVP